MACDSGFLVLGTLVIQYHPLTLSVRLDFQSLKKFHKGFVIIPKKVVFNDQLEYVLASQYTVLFTLN